MAEAAPELDTRSRIVQATAELFSQQGSNGTGVKQIVERANAPFGSLYHFFPGGKTELTEEVIRSSGTLYLGLIDEFFADASDPTVATQAFFDAAAEALEEMDFADPCPVATVSMEVASTSERLRAATAEVFESWIERTARHLQAAGLTADAARELAGSLLITLQGAFMLGRAFRDGEHVRRAGELVSAAAASAAREGG